MGLRFRSHDFWIFIIRRKHAWTNKIPVVIFKKYNDPTIKKEVVMATEQSRKRHLAHINFEEEEALVTNWLHQINEKDCIIVEKITKRD